MHKTHLINSDSCPLSGTEQDTVSTTTYLRKWLTNMHPAYFALVMATGIISIDCYLMGLKEIALILFGCNILFYVVLWVLYSVRACLFPHQFATDWHSHKRAFGFFTVIAATSVLGSQFVLIGNNPIVAQALWWTGLALWTVFTYSIFVFLIVQPKKPSLEEGINGGWLIAVVATQSICVLGCAVKPALFGAGEFYAFMLLSFWLFGGMLYIWLISLIFYRYMFFSFEPSDLIPPYWINMGAMAITTLAGAELIRVFGDVPGINAMLPFLKGLTTMFWATATWWIPMLVVLGIWRHGIRRFRFVYDPLYWGLVFPLGMYSVCTLKLAAILNIPMLTAASSFFLFFGLVAWLLTFLSMVQRPLFALLIGLRKGHSARLKSATLYNLHHNKEDKTYAQ